MYIDKQKESDNTFLNKQTRAINISYWNSINIYNPLLVTIYVTKCYHETPKTIKCQQSIQSSQKLVLAW
jgi:hypothetical protein